MSSVHVRPFERSDRDQVTALVNAHIAAVVPNLSVSVQTMMSQLEREPGEFIVDPWVRERATLVAEQRDRIVAAAHLLRYGAQDSVGETYRDAGEIRWLVYWPPASYWPDSEYAGDALAAACLTRLRSWGVRRCYADGALPAPGVYGVPEPWPHIAETYRRAGFTDGGSVEEVFLARVCDLPRTDPPHAGLVERRSLGVNGTRISAHLDGVVIGSIEVDTTLDDAARTSRTGSWADIGNLDVDESHRGQGVGTWLLGRAAEWLELGGVDRVLDYADADDAAYARFLQGRGFRPLTRTTRAFELPLGAPRRSGGRPPEKFRS